MPGISVGSVSVAIVPDARGFSAKLDALTRGVKVQVEAVLDASGVRRQLDEITRSVTTTVNVNANTAEASARIDEAARDRIATINVDADTVAARAQVKALDSSMAGLSGRTQAIVTAVAGLGPALVPVVAATSAVTVGLGSALTAALTGVSAFAVFAVPAYTEMANKTKDLAKAQHAVNAATSDKTREKALVRQKALIEGTDPAMLKALDRLDALKVGYHQLQSALAPQIWSAFNTGLDIATAGLPLLLRIAQGAAPVIIGLGRSLAQALTTDSARRFVGFLSSEAGPSLQAFARIAANVASGVGGLIVAFAPLGRTVTESLARLTAQFADFGNGRTNGLSQFLGYMQSVGPEVSETLGALVRAAGHLLVALAPIGGLVLSGLHGFANVLLSIPTGTLTVVAAEIVAVIGAAQGLKAVTSIANGFRGALGSISSIGTRLQTAGANLQHFGGVATVTQSRVGGMTAGLGRVVSVLGGPWGVALGVAGSAVAALALQHYNAVKAAKAFVDQLTFENGALDTNSRAALANNLAKEGTLSSAIKAGISEKAYTDALLAGGPARQAMIDQLRRIQENTTTYVNAGQGTIPVLSSQGEAAKKAADELQTLGGQLDNGARSARQADAALGATASATTAVGAAATAATQPTAALQRAQAELSAAQSRVAAATQKVIDNFTILRSGALSSAEAQLALQSSFINMTASVKANGTSLSQHTAKGIANRTAIIDSIKAVNDKITSDFKANEATKGLTKATDIASGSLKSNRKRLEEAATAAGFSKREVKKMIDQYVLTPKALKTEVSTPGSKAAKSEIRDLQDKINKLQGKKITLTYSTNAAKLVKQTALNLGYDIGGPKALGGIVGEGRARGGILPGFTPLSRGDDIAFPMATGGIQPLRSGEGIYVSEAMRDPYERSRLLAVNKAALRGESLAQFRGLAGGGIVRSVTANVNSSGLGIPDFGRLSNAIASTLTSGVEKSISRGVKNALDRMSGGNTGAALGYARAHVGHPYQFGTLWDCSGFISALHSIAKNEQPHRRYVTTSFVGDHANGFTRGKHSGFMVGVNPKPGKSGHMAGTINGVNVESAGGVGVRVGKSARGYNSPMFSWRGGLAVGGLVPGRDGDLPYDLINPRGQRYDAGLARAVRLATMRNGSETFDAGGWLQPGTTIVHNNSGKPEPVFSTAQWDLLRQGRGGASKHFNEGATFYGYTPADIVREQRSADRLDEVLSPGW